MAVTAALVKELRERTGAGMMDCKKALVETDGDIEKAIDYLREKGIMKAQKKAGRIAAEGLVRVAFGEGNKTASIVEVNSETDFVAKNEEFIEFVEDLAKEVLAKGNMPMEQFMAEPFGEGTVQETLTAKVAKIGENLSIRRFAKVEEDGVVYVGYTHGGGRIGVIVGIKTDAAADEIAAVGKDVAMQVASMNPKFVNEDGVDPEYLENEKKILTEQVLNEGKKPEMVERIVAGKIKKELKEVCLLDQPFVKDGDVSVQQYVANAAKEIGKDMEVVSMIRYEVGEGIEKKEDDFAAEVAAQVAGN
ncbi:MAG: translation elongation factor Ts [Clostridia bacterium]|uniref:translation elongation factor Ts n=1 Tax=Mogibacterium TaxID=86331 RepID=UPI0024097CB0|nr:MULTISPECIES: translation elongation factor Ts [Mogibacterium]MCI7124055.1 translation elongation factor Ts [Mogibacterium sp.]MDD6700918.1 translation elongation factor Ts [Mogibacterium kristiansenii]MDY5450042.1 translation elongation factor Ts [Clostridia bacterium]MEE0369581.1 translation elongation factor Ts [Clostridia bacterium]